MYILFSSPELTEFGAPSSIECDESPFTESTQALKHNCAVFCFCILLCVFNNTLFHWPYTTFTDGISVISSCLLLFLQITMS